MSTRYPTPWECTPVFLGYRKSSARQNFTPRGGPEKIPRKMVPGHRILESFLEGFSNILSPLAIKTTSQFGEGTQEQARRSFTNLALIQVGVILL